MINAATRSSRSFSKLRLLTRNVRTQAKYDYTPQPDDLDDSPYMRPAGLATPRQVRHTYELMELGVQRKISLACSIPR